jgi:hypothetical protein
MLQPAMRAEWLTTHIAYAPERLAVIEAFVATCITSFSADADTAADGAVPREALPLYYRVRARCGHGALVVRHADVIKWLCVGQVHLKELADALAPTSSGTWLRGCCLPGGPARLSGWVCGADVDASAETEARLSYMHRAAVCYGSLIQFIKTMQACRGLPLCAQPVCLVVSDGDAALQDRAVLLAGLKQGRLFLDRFERHCVPVLEACFLSHSDSVIAILKTVQVSTRALQNLCGHSKVSRDLALTAHVPPLRRVLETLIFRVKAMLDANQCLSAFWIGVCVCARAPTPATPCGSHPLTRRDAWAGGRLYDQQATSSTGR